MNRLTTLLATIVVASATLLASCEKSDDSNNPRDFEDVTLQTEVEVGDDSSSDPSDTTTTTPVTVKGLAADGASRLVVAIPADSSNPATKITITPSVEWGTLSGDETIYTINDEDLYLFTLKSSEELPAGLSDAAVTSIDYTIEATFADGSTKSATKSVAVVRPAVIFAHGLASGAETFDPMLGYIEAMGLFIPEALYALDYSTTSVDSYQTNNRVVPEAIDDTFESMLGAGYVAKRATLIGHSMGGILTRIYIQDGVFEADGTTQKEPYRGDIMKVITIDTPHSGSQLADFALDLAERHTAFEIFSDMGAIVDLAVKSKATADLNKASKLATANALQIPTHVITAHIGTVSDVFQLITDKQYIFAALTFILDAAESKLIYGENETSDIVVPTTSQEGGVVSSLTKKYITTYSNEWHCTVHTTEEAATDVVALLNTASSDTKSFTTSGFAPAKLTYTSNASISISKITEAPNSDDIDTEIFIYIDDSDKIIGASTDGVDIGDTENATKELYIARKTDGSIVYREIIL